MSKEVKDACDSEIANRKARVEKIAKILEAVKYKTETDRLEAVLSFSRSTLSESEIAHIMAPGKEDYNTQQIDKKGMF